MIFPKAFVNDINTAINYANELLKGFKALHGLKPKNAPGDCFVYKSIANLGIR